MTKEEEEIIIRGTIIEAKDFTKIARLTGENVKPQQVIKILLDEISDEEFTKLMFVDKVKIILEKEVNDRS